MYTSEGNIVLFIYLAATVFSYFADNLPDHLKTFILALDEFLF